MHQVATSGVFRGASLKLSQGHFPSKKNKKQRKQETDNWQIKPKVSAWSQSLESFSIYLFIILVILVNWLCQRQEHTSACTNQADNKRTLCFSFVQPDVRRCYSFILSVHMQEEGLNNSSPLRRTEALTSRRDPTSHLVHLHGDRLSICMKPRETQTPFLIVKCGQRVPVQVDWLNSATRLRRRL